MNDEITNIVCAHYLYVPTEDYSVVKSIWNSLVGKFGLTGGGPENILSGEQGLAHSTPFFLKNTRVAIGLLILKTVTVIEILSIEGSNQITNPVEELKDIKQDLQDQADYIIGETTLNILKNPTGEHELGKLSTMTRPGEFEIKDVLLSSLRSDDKWHRFYTAYPRNEDVATPFLTSKFPSIDALLFKLERQSPYFKDQRSFINSKKKEADRGLSDILNQWSDIDSSPENKIELLEKDVEKLSNMYSELVASLRLVKNAHDTMARDLRRLDHLLTGSETGIGISYLRDGVISKYANLLQNLELDDKLLHRSLDDTRATIDVVRTRIDLERGRESVLLQKEGVSVQTAAGFIELFIVWFYTLEAWEILATPEVFEHISIPLRLGADIMFAAAVVAFTHFAAKLVRKEKARVGLLVSGFGIAVAIALMLVLTLSSKG